MGFDLKCIKCGMGRIFTINAESQVGEIRVRGRREKKGEKTRVGYIQGDAGFESETRESKRRNHGRRNSRRGVRVAGMADAEKSRL